MTDQPLRPINLLIAGACLFIIMFGIKETAVIINPILLAVIITIAVLPLPKKLTARRVPSNLALVLTILAVVGAMLAVILLFVVGIYQLQLELPTYAADISARSTEFTNWYNQRTSTTTTTTTTEVDSQQITDYMGNALAALGNLVVQIGMTLLIFIFMISAAITMPKKVRSGLDTASPVVDRVSNFTADVRKYLTVTTTINMLVGLGDAIILLIIGVDFAFLWGVLAWLLGYIPTIGFWLALIPPTILAWAQFGAPTAFVVFLAFVLINGSVQNFVQPKMMGDNLNISPVIVFLSLFIWGWLLGGIGALLAVPLTLLILAIMENFEITRGIVMLARPSSATTKEKDEEEKQKARQMVSGWWEKGKSIVNPKSDKVAE